MSELQMRELLDKIKGVKVGVYGDFCLDAYWILNPSGSEVSVETGVQASAVERHYYRPGGAANVTANMAALDPASLMAIGSIGDDIFGRELTRLLGALGIDTTSLIIQSSDFATLAFNKHYLDLDEKLRVDFGTRNVRSEDTDKSLLSGLEKALRECDIVVFNQQVPGTLENEPFIDGANRLFADYPEKIVLLDSRHYGDRFEGVGRKINEVESALLCGVDARPRNLITRTSAIEYGRILYERSGKPVFITRGPRGILSFDKTGWSEIPGIQTDGELDTVGAGDTTMSAIALSLAAGISAAEAAEFANIAASVTVQKLRQTGTANPEEILDLHAEVRYIHHPELADGSETINYLPGNRVELCSAPTKTPVRYALFDHDGTISTLRHGWEEVMEPVMIKAILGSENRDDEVVAATRKAVLEYIDRSTGIQTILQMEALRQMVIDAGLVPAESVLSAAEYKEIYNQELMVNVTKRMQAVQQGETAPETYIIPGAVDFLTHLKNSGITLFLASGTDRDDVVGEAQHLGYADLFDGGIYGAVGDIRKYSKKKLLREIIEKNRLKHGELLVVGDGPVEIQECRRQNGIAVGIASNEADGGLDAHKRKRLIRAGAHFILPDLTHGKDVLKYLR